MLLDKTLKDLLEPDLDIMHDSFKCFLTYYFVSGSDITACIKIDKRLVDNRFWYCYVLTAVIMLRMCGKILVFSRIKRDFEVVFGPYDK